MRKLASFDDPAFAEALYEVLYAADIRGAVRPGPDEANTVWIESETDLLRAQMLLADFVAAPDDPRYAGARAAVRDKREAEAKAARASRHKVVEVRKTLRERAIASPVTAGLLLACIAVALLSGMGTHGSVLRYLTIVSFDRMGGFVRWSGYRDLLDGQVWRLFTPVLIHFGPFHLLFNAFWLNDLGAPIERYQGSLRYAAFLLFSAAVSNIAQLQFGQGPNFGGLSGIVYALVGYLWARGRADPKSGLFVPGRLVSFFVFWMALGFSGLLSDMLGQMANYCHLGGFAAGALYGYIAARIAVARVRH
jgi:GlpG protein